MGIYTYEVSAEGYKTVQARIGVLEDKTITIEMETNLKLVDFSSGTDEEIAAMLDAHYAGKINISDYWAVGDTRLVHLNAISVKSYASKAHVAQDMTMVIIGFNHDDLKEQLGSRTKAAITVQCREVLGNNGNLVQEYYWGKYIQSANSDNWINNPMRQWNNEDFVNALPSKFGSLIKTVQKKNLIRHNTTSGSPVISEDKVFWLSYPEVFGISTYTNYLNGANPSNYEGNQYQYYKTSANRKKTANNNGSSGASGTGYWWLRSPASSSSSGFGYSWIWVYNDGMAATMRGTNAEGGLAPAFCL